jgi:YD repeat-containing protein
MRATAGHTLTLSIALVMFFITPVLQAAEFYRSNAVGIRGERLDGFPDPQAADSQDSDGPAYVLEVSFVDGTEIRRLFRDEEEIQRVEVTRDGSTTTEAVFRDDLLESRTVSRDNGVLLGETRYSGGVLTERWEFHYEGAMLTSREAFDPADELLYRESYSYWRDGTLRSIVKEDRSEVRTEYRYQDGRLEEEWVSRPDEAERFEFDTAGRLVIRELFSENELTEQEVRLYWGSDSASLLKQVVVSAGDEGTTRGYDERGRLTSERIEESGRFVRELTRVFGEDRLVLEIETDNAGESRWEYQYTDNGARESVTFRENGELVEVSHLVLDPQEEPADRMTELFNRGQPVLRVYYDGQQRLREEVIRDGVVIRTREFASAATGSGGPAGSGTTAEDGGS